MYERWVDDFEGLALNTLDKLAVDEPAMGSARSPMASRPAARCRGRTCNPKGCSYFTPLGSEICCVRVIIAGGLMRMRDGGSDWSE